MGGTLIISTPNKFSIYFPQKIYLQMRYGSKHPYDKWKGYLALKKKLRGLGFNMADTRGACYLPGLIAYKGRLRRLITRFLPFLARVEKAFLSRAFTKYFGYILIIKASKIPAKSLSCNCPKVVP